MQGEKDLVTIMCALVTRRLNYCKTFYGGLTLNTARPPVPAAHFTGKGRALVCSAGEGLR